ncbi:DUF1311 domain-containing protein [Aureibaculum sp. A20]|uniref:DUF1311 domain-containing protein n=1 Tax=Aureibaculum flavum TaxID=2795986 RepID=A0ABS0WV34_9FLAO|nr:lysozyme inhibitor LprI family protein [Aureibaculum flavum]MBJ2175861.1 DUF1311 domain-containing protein [Aureibaculum flavum]
MKKILSFLILIISINCFSQTQGEMNKDAHDSYNKSDKILNDIYKMILSKYDKDTLFIQNLKKSQRIWIQFRDAEMAMKYPEYPNRLNGSVHPMCTAIHLKRLTDNRITTLKKWLAGSEEGDLCNGSVKMVEEIDTEFMEKAHIDKMGSVLGLSNMKKDHRIFGYKEMSIYSEKMILISIFTDEVKHNIFDCKYGAYYDMSSIKDFKIKYKSTNGAFLKMEIIKDGAIIDEIYMEKKWFIFDE